MDETMLLNNATALLHIQPVVGVRRDGCSDDRCIVHHMEVDMAGYVIITEDGVDQIVETKELANREARDLRKLGCEVKIKRFDSMADAEIWADKQR